MRFSKWQDLAAIGVLFAILVAIVSTAAGWWCEIYGFLNDWQTLATGILAIVAARWTVLEMQEGRKATLAQQAKADAGRLLSNQSRWHNWRNAHVAYAMDLLFQVDDLSRPFLENAKDRMDRLDSVTNEALSVLLDPEWLALQEQIGIDGAALANAVLDLKRENLTARGLHREALEFAISRHPISGETLVNMEHPTVQKLNVCMSNLNDKLRAHVENIGKTHLG